MSIARLTILSTTIYSNNELRLKLNPKSKPKTNQIRCTSILSLSTASLSLNSIRPFVQSQWKPILGGWFCSAISVFSLSKLVPRLGQYSTLLGAGDHSALKNEAFVIAALLLLRLIANYWQQALLWDAALNSVYKIRLDVYEKVLQRELGFFEGRGGASAGDIAYRISAEASDVADTVYALLNTIVPCLLQLFAMATQMICISPALASLSALVIPCMSITIAYLGERLCMISKKARLSIAKLSAYLNEVLPSILFVKANNAEPCEIRRFQLLAHANLSAHLKKKKMKALIPQIVQMIYFGVLAIFCVGAMISSGSFSSSLVISFTMSLVLLIEPIQGVGKAYNELKEGEPAIERLFELTKFNLVAEKPDAFCLDSVKGEVKFCDVTFGYGDDLPLVLNGLDLHLNPGETVAIVGPSGGGKSTLVKLLLRLYDPLCGCIMIDNYDIQSICLGSLRRHVALVSQDITLFSGTVAENIGYRDLTTNIDMERVELVAQAANADEFIRILPEGYRTDIGPRGSVLSGGQKQRLAIARALYQDPSILVLDEATSALDSRSERLVRQALEHLMKNHTVIVIAHRLETILMAKRVFLLKGGKLKEISRLSLLHGNGEMLRSVGIVI
ncbi:ABC transporter-like, ATP-binding domain [Dillenia turbinata]|uniref:ABC transporter-like, ATP-binding domain n=1 Tax=Dillenia turbinata TaxID=194707 RepID=A0AAN8UHX7_9MAGN